MRSPRYRLAALTSHPIQYQAPLFRALSETGEVDLDVLFCSSGSVGVHHDDGFGVEFAWDRPLLDGYRHSFLKNVSPRPNPSRFFGCINPQVGHALAKGRYDAVWVHGWALASCWLGFSAANRHRIPLLLRGESNLLHEPGGLKGQAKRFLLTRLFDRASACLAVGTSNSEFYAAYGAPKRRIFLSPYAVDNDFFLMRSKSLAGEKRLLRERDGILPDLPVILFCGKLTGVKRPMDLLKAFQQLGDDVQGSLVFVGDGPLRGELQHYVVQQGLKRVHFLGFRNQSELPACYALADIFVLPSEFEPWGLVVNEAMCSRLPLIASDKVGAAADLIQEGVNGLTFAAGDVDALAGRLRKLVADEALRETMGAQSQLTIARWGISETVLGILRALEYAVPPIGSI